jgi:protocatechuate 3,4-dioxygenase beta subunit
VTGRLAAVAGLAALLSASAATAASSAPAATCHATKSDVAGPFETSGAVSPLRAKIGTGHILAGRVLRAPDCRPIAGAVVEFWQAGPNGYTRSGRGSVVTDRQGRFRFEGPVPAADDGFPPHIHILVRYGGYEDLLVRYVVPRGERTGHVTFVLSSLL